MIIAKVLILLSCCATRLNGLSLSSSYSLLEKEDVAANIFVKNSVTDSTILALKISDLEKKSLVVGDLITQVRVKKKIPEAAQVKISIDTNSGTFVDSRDSVKAGRTYYATVLSPSLFSLHLKDLSRDLEVGDEDCLWRELFGPTGDGDDQDYKMLSHTELLDRFISHQGLLVEEPYETRMSVSSDSDSGSGVMKTSWSTHDHDELPIYQTDAAKKQRFLSETGYLVMDEIGEDTSVPSNNAQVAVPLRKQITNEGSSWRLNRMQLSTNTGLGSEFFEARSYFGTAILPSDLDKKAREYISAFPHSPQSSPSQKYAWNMRIIRIHEVRSWNPHVTPYGVILDVIYTTKSETATSQTTKVNFFEEMWDVPSIKLSYRFDFKKGATKTGNFYPRVTGFQITRNPSGKDFYPGGLITGHPSLVLHLENGPDDMDTRWFNVARDDDG